MKTVLRSTKSAVALIFALIVGSFTISLLTDPAVVRGGTVTPSSAAGGSFSAASPGPIGGTTSGTGQFTAACTGASPCTLPAAGQFSSGSAPLIVSSSAATVTGTAYAINANTGSGVLELNTLAGNSINFDVAGSSKFNISPGGASYAFDNTVGSMSRMPLSFDAGSIATVTTATNFACFKTVKALTIENNEGVLYSNTACAAGGAVIRTYDCGATAPTNANCSGGTQLTTVSLGTVVGTVVDGTVNSANVAAGEYVCAQIQAAGSCTAIDFDVTSMARPQ